MKSTKIFTPDVMALESVIDDVLPLGTNVSTEGLVDEIKKGYRKLKTRLSGGVKDREKASSENDKAVDAVEKGLRYVKSQVSSARFDKSRTKDLNRAISKMKIDAGSSPTQLLSNVNKRVNTLEASISHAKEAGALAANGNGEKAKKILQQQEEAIKKSEGSNKAKGTMEFTKKQMLELIDQGGRAIAVYRKARASAINKIPGLKNVSLEDLDSPALEAEDDSTAMKIIKSIAMFILGVAVAILQIVVAIWVIVLFLCNPILFLFVTAAALLIASIIDEVQKTDTDD